MSDLEHLQSAYEHLVQAEEEANMGTRLMIQPIRQELGDLIDSTERIQDTTDD